MDSRRYWAISSEFLEESCIHGLKETSLIVFEIEKENLYILLKDPIFISISQVVTFPTILTVTLNLVSPWSGSSGVPEPHSRQSSWKCLRGTSKKPSIRTCTPERSWHKSKWWALSFSYSSILVTLAIAVQLAHTSFHPVGWAY